MMNKTSLNTFSYLIVQKVCKYIYDLNRVETTCSLYFNLINKVFFTVLYL